MLFRSYGDSYRYWIVLFANQILDPQWDWPLNDQQFNSYINDKYGYNENLQTWSVLNPYATTYQWQKIITQYDAATQTTTVNTVIIDEDTYNSLIETSNTYTLPTGQVAVKVTKKSLTYYDWELEKNESKRNIKILRKDYAAQIENNLKDLMA